MKYVDTGEQAFEPKTPSTSFLSRRDQLFLYCCGVSLSGRQPYYNFSLSALDIIWHRTAVYVSPKIGKLFQHVQSTFYSSRVFPLDKIICAWKFMACGKFGVVTTGYYYMLESSRFHPSSWPRMLTCIFFFCQGHEVIYLFIFLPRKK